MTALSVAIVNRILDPITVPVTGLVVRATWDDPTDLLSRHDRDIVVALTDRHTRAPVRESTDGSGHWADIVQVSERYWVTRHIDIAAAGEEHIAFASFDDAYSHYTQVVHGQQDATAGQAWNQCDVPGVLAGDDLILATRAGYSYEDAARQYAVNPTTALTSWTKVATLQV